MASKFVNNFYKIRFDKYINKITNSRYVATKLINFRYKNVQLRTRVTFKGVRIIFPRQKVFNYRSNLKFIENRVLPIKIRFSNALSDLKYLNKGCNGVICTIENENNVIAKQAYKFDPYENDTSEIKNENDILDKLQCHPNIIQKINETEILSDICQDIEFINSCPDVEHNGLTPTLILERMDMSLEELLKMDPLDIDDRIDILSQILEAQVFMNHRSICHRDMKLSNILVKFAPYNQHHLIHPRKFIIKVADFDCALDMNVAAQRNISHRGANICTSPEILNMTSQTSSLNIRKLYSKNDIWAIGGMAYEIFGLENPFVKINARTYTIIDLPDLGSVPKVVQNVIRSLLHPESSCRYQSCVAADILQIFRLKSLIAEEVFQLVEKFSIEMMVAFCYLNNLYYTGARFLSNPQRMAFVLHYIKE